VEKVYLYAFISRESTIKWDLSTYDMLISTSLS